MTDILSAVVLKFNCINKISCSLISAVEGKYPHLYFWQEKAFRGLPTNPSLQPQLWHIWGFHANISLYSTKIIN